MKARCFQESAFGFVCRASAMLSARQEVLASPWRSWGRLHRRTRTLRDLSFLKSSSAARFLAFHALPWTVCKMQTIVMIGVAFVREIDLSGVTLPPRPPLRQIGERDPPICYDRPSLPSGG
jgi:hypothetical protein